MRKPLIIEIQNTDDYQYWELNLIACNVANGLQDFRVIQSQSDFKGRARDDDCMDFKDKIYIKIKERSS